MSFDNFSELTFRPLSYQDGIDEIDAFYPSPGNDAHNTARISTLNGAVNPSTAPTDQESALSEVAELTKSVEQPRDFEPSTEAESSSRNQINHAESTLHPHDKATPPQSGDEGGPYQLARYQAGLTSTLTMEHTTRSNGSDARSGSPVPPSSSNRGELQAEMRHEEEDQPIRVKNLVPLPFSLSGGKGGGDRKREASASPSSVTRPVLKKTKTDSDEMMASSPPVSTSSPSKTATIHDSLSLDVRHVLAESEQQIIGESLQSGSLQALHASTVSKQAGNESAIRSTTAPREVLRPDTLPCDDTSTQDGSSASDTDTLSNVQETTNDKGSKAASKAAAPRHRRPMGTSELKDLIGTNVLGGVYANMSPQRMTRHQKQERDALRPGASTKEAVQRRRQWTGRDLK